ncbi:prolipoprotein diacylglyceryl transferase family protein [Sorangium sp. So ce1182]|uniref:prolipoprotein diacylglyceryl transferase family protein n=1 Tax=Sorangium sp. So ce1182 TaxID=3133334 RepID=UPI003F6133ED
MSPRFGSSLEPAPSSQRRLDSGSLINHLLDALPRPRLFRGSCARPAFRSLGVAGYHAALVATLGTGLLAGRSALVLAAIAAVCAASFFCWAYLRRAITGRETLVLLEHVWIAELASAAALYFMREPILPYLDCVSVGLSVFLAFGRMGCLLVGCCHGHPASIGVRYGEECARDGFPAHLVGVRLFPVQALEALSLSGIALVGLGLAAGSEPGRALAWFLAAYAVLRFGLEGLRSDERPHLLGLSQARWMALAELGAALAIGERSALPTPGRIGAAVFLLATLLVALVLARRLDPRPGLLARAHLSDVRANVIAAARAASAGGSPAIEVRRTSAWVSTGVSLFEGGRAAHVSIALPPNHHDLRLLCDVAAGALPELEAGSGHTSPAALLHVRVPLPLAAALPAAASGVADALYGATVRRQQAADAGERERSAEQSAAPARVAEQTAAPARVTPPAAPFGEAASLGAPASAPHRDAPRTQRAKAGDRSPWDPRIPAELGDELRREWRRVPAQLDTESPPRLNGEERAAVRRTAAPAPEDRGREEDGFGRGVA